MIHIIDQYPNIKIHPLIQETIDKISLNYEKIKEECENLVLKSRVLNVKRGYGWQESQPAEGWVYSWSEKGDWLNYGLISNYKIIESNKNTCPILMNLLAPLFKIGMVKVAGFSRMLPGCNLKTHKHFNIEKITWHLGLIVPDPEKCVLTVDGKEYKQREGQWIRFNDSFNHSSTNFTDKERVILYLKLKEF